MNGLIIPPGEFSTVDAIGEVNAATGYFQEYVIKGDRTIPEYGGGLCQIGTTMFRVALYSGLPITERRPHSYIVSYYNPLGMDATIYGPHPDLRFNNDTGYNILLQIKIDGTELTFEFWGTSDGRKTEITDPVLYNWTGIPADKLIENIKLKPGEKKKMETGRRGADSHFYRYITKADGVKAEEIFRSHYVAWPNIYEVGVTPKPEVPATDSISEPSTSNSAAAGESGTTNTNTNSTQ
ncbi:MAG: VanW family protein [Candidatus Parcubacteria bacterium]|nr:VanW family protein [Candidatus Parcubacteria bacterium]